MIPVEFTETARAYQLLSELEQRHVIKLLPLAKDAHPKATLLLTTT